MKTSGEQKDPAQSQRPSPVVLMLLTNAYDPDPRVRQEALALIHMGCTVRLLAWDRDLKHSEHDCIEGVAVRRVFLRSRHGRGNTQILFYAWLYLKMLWIVWWTRFDVVHCHDLDTLPLGFLVGKLKRKPVVYDAHESFPEMLEGNIHPAIQRALFALENFFIRRTDLLITVGEKLRKYFDQRGARRSAVVGNWKDLDEYSHTPHQIAETRRSLGIPEDAMVVVCITQLFNDRKIEELLQAVDRFPDVYLVIGGKGILQARVIAAAESNPRIRYVGFVAAANIPAYTCAADVVYYGFDPENPNARFSAPNKLFEALAAGKPLITGDFGEIADVVRQTDCGIVLSEYSAETIQTALQTLQQPDVRRAMALNARRFGSTWMNWRNGEDILHREYSRLLPIRLKKPLRKGEALSREVEVA